MHGARKETTKGLEKERGLPWRLVHVTQGECVVLADPSRALTTLLGSCIAACIRDPASGIGGMNHFLLPAHANDEDASLRYGVNAMEALMNEVSAKAAVARVALEIKVFGGANVQAGLGSVGHRNASFVEAFLAREELHPAALHLRGEQPRKIIYHPASGRALMRYARAVDPHHLAMTEERIAEKTLDANSSGEIEMFT